MAQLTVAQWEQAGMGRSPAAAGAGHQMPATSDSGYASEAAGMAVEQGGFEPSMAPGRQRHPAPAAAGPEPPVTAQDRRATKGQTPEGRALYARGTVIVEPVCGQRKEARGFRRFLLRGLQHIRGEWRLVCLTHNVLKLWRYECAPITGSPAAMAS